MVLYVYNQDDSTQKFLHTVTNGRAKQQQPRRWKHMLIHQGHLLDSQSFEFLICILQALNMPLIRCTNVFYKGGYPVTLLPPPRRLAPSLCLGNTWVRQLRSGSCHHPTDATKCNEWPSRTTANPRVDYCAI